jgi:geranylgeranyl pyrophosphate synthase
LPKTIDDAWMRKTLGPARWRYAPEVATRMVSDPTWALISRGGKHWRSVFGILMLRALGADVESYEELITVIPELLHVGSLMIDDIQDKSALRRGGPAIHRIHGQAATINAGNALYFLPLLTVSRHPLLSLQQRDDIYRISYDLFIRAHFGQAQDLFSEQWVDRDDVLGNLDRYAQDVLQTYTFKTAAPVRALAEILCVIAETDSKTRDACMAYAEAAGIAYQIIDDVNNFIGDETWGKEVGEDIRERRLTYVVIRALDALSSVDQRRLWHILRSGAGSMSTAQQAEACDLVQRSGVLESSRAQARAMVDDAWIALSSQVAPSQSRVLLRLLVTRLFSARA